MIEPLCVIVRAGRLRACLAGILAVVGEGPLMAQSTAEIARMATPATVTIVTFDAQGAALGQGSGFVVRNDGVLVTNYHVMRGATRATVKLASGETFGRVEALEVDPERDLAILKIPGFGMRSLSPVAGSPAVGENLVVIGAPRGLDFTVSEGIVSAVRMIDGTEWIQMSAPISPGSSGGPVLDERGAVIGVTTAYRNDGQALNFAIPIRYAMGLVTSAGSPRALAAAFPSLLPEPQGAGAAEAVVTFAAPSTQADASWLVDAYSVRGLSRLYEGTKTYSRSWAGLMLLAANNTGLVVRAWNKGDGSLEPASVSFVVSSFATDRGRVLLEAGTPWTGYFTADGGMALVSDTTISDGRLVDSVVATPYEVDLALPTGLYRVSWNAAWSPRGSRRAGEPLAWQGRVAVAVLRDSVWLDLRLTNSSGGTAAFFGAGPVRDGRFKLVGHDGSELAGILQAGQISAAFTDKREKGLFAGPLRGTRE